MNKLRDLINLVAQEIRNAYGISVPIENIDEVVEKMGGKIESIDCMPEDMDGCIRKDDSGEKFIIYVSEDQTPARRMFTIAHELGHLFLHMGYQIDPEKWKMCGKEPIYRRGENSNIEYQANEFAAAFLMPKDLYIEQVEKNTEGDSVNTEAIASHFNVSISAATYRGKYLGLLEW